MPSLGACGAAPRTATVPCLILADFLFAAETLIHVGDEDVALRVTYARALGFCDGSARRDRVSCRTIRPLLRLPLLPLLPSLPSLLSLPLLPLLALLALLASHPTAIGVAACTEEADCLHLTRSRAAQAVAILRDAFGMDSVACGGDPVAFIKRWIPAAEAHAAAVAISDSPTVRGQWAAAKKTDMQVGATWQPSFDLSRSGLHIPLPAAVCRCLPLPASPA